MVSSTKRELNQIDQTNEPNPFNELVKRAREILPVVKG